MKIGIISSEFHPLNAAASARAGSWVSYFREFGHEVTVFTSSNALPEKRFLVRSWFSTPDNRASIIRRLAQEVLLGVDLAFRMIFNARRTQMNLITSPPFFMAVFCAFACRLCRIPYVFDVRDRYPNALFELGLLARDKWAGRLLQNLESLLYCSSAFVSTVTKGLASDIKAFCPGRELFLSRNGYDERIFLERLLRKKKFSSFTVVYHGRLGRFYDQDTLCEVILILEKLQPRIRFLMIGDLKGFQAKRTWRTVEFMDEMPLGELAPVLTKCHLGICLLKETDAMKKALPAKAFDFWGAGLPIIASPEGELAETIEKNGSGIAFKENDSDRIAQSIIKLHGDQELLEGLRGSVLAGRSQFGRRKQAKRLLEKLEKEMTA